MDVEAETEVPRRITAPRKPLGRRRISYTVERFGLVIAWLVEIALFGLLRPRLFLTTGNFSAIFTTQAVLLVLSLALLIPLTVGEFDLSVAGSLGLSYILVGYLSIVHHWPVSAAIVVAILSGVVTGLVNAFFIIVVQVESIVVTLGTGTILTGIGYGLLNGPVVGISNGVVNTLDYQIFSIGSIFYIGVLLTITLWYVYALTPLGRYMYFVGINRSVARLSGINGNRLRAGALVVAALISSFGGVLLAGSTGASDPNTSSGYLLPVFAAVFLGATAITPGRFNPVGTFVAVYFLTTGVTGLELMGYTGWVEQVFYGVALVVAVTVSRLAGRRAASAGVV